MRAKIMKTKFFMFLFAACAVMFASCSDDDDFVPETSVITAFNDKYPEAKKVSWEKKMDFKVAEFIHNNHEKEAWFDVQGTWFMTETDIRFDELPLAIQEHFVLSQYSAWHVDDVDMIERYNTETIYIIEVEKGEQEIDLVYAADGTLIKEVYEDTGKQHQPLVINEVINKFIQDKYQGAKIIEYDDKGGRIEVDILHDKLYKEVLFTTEGKWLRTEWDIPKADLPLAVLATIEKDYAGYKIDDIEQYERPEETLYFVELEKGDDEIKVCFTEEGVVVKFEID